MPYLTGKKLKKHRKRSQKTFDLLKRFLKRNGKKSIDIIGYTITDAVDYGSEDKMQTITIQVSATPKKKD